MSTTAQLSWLTSSRNYPFISKRTFELTLNEPAATGSEIFWGIQVVYTEEQTSPPLVLVKSGDETGAVNPIYAGLNGGVYAVAGRGIVTSGTDVHGKEYSVSPTPGYTVIALGGDQSIGNTVAYTD